MAELNSWENAEDSWENVEDSWLTSLSDKTTGSTNETLLFHDDKCISQGKSCVPFHQTVSVDANVERLRVESVKPKRDKIDELAQKIALFYKDPRLNSIKNSAKPTLMKSNGRNNDPLCTARLALGRVNKTYMSLPRGGTIETIFSAILNGGYIITTTTGNQSKCSELRKQLAEKQASLDFHSAKFRNENAGVDTATPEHITVLSGEVRQLKADIKKFNPISKKENNTQMLNSVISAITILNKRDFQSDRLISLIREKLGFVRPTAIPQVAEKHVTHITESNWRGRSNMNSSRATGSSNSNSNWRSSGKQSSSYSSDRDSSKYSGRQSSSYSSDGYRSKYSDKQSSSYSNNSGSSGGMNYSSYARQTGHVPASASNRFSHLAEQPKVKDPVYDNKFPELMKSTAVSEDGGNDEGAVLSGWAQIAKLAPVESKAKSIPMKSPKVQPVIGNSSDDEQFSDFDQYDSRNSWSEDEIDEGVGLCEDFSDDEIDGDYN